MHFSSTYTYDLHWKPYKFFMSFTLFHSLIKYFLKNILLQVVLSCHVLDLLMPLIPILEKNREQSAPTSLSVPLVIEQISVEPPNSYFPFNFFL